MDNETKKKKESEFDRDTSFGDFCGIGDVGGSAGEKSGFGNDVDESEGEQNRNRSGSTGYRQSVIDKLSVEVLGKELSGNEDKIMEATESLTKDMASLDEPASGTKGNPEIEHFETPYSFKHSFDEATLVQGDKTMKTPTFGVTDDVASGNKKVKKAE